MRAYLLDERVPGERAAAERDPFDVFELYVRQWLSDDPHVCAEGAPSGSSTVLWRLCG